MKTIHLLCHLDAYQSMDIQSFGKYAMMESDKDFISSKWQEEDDLMIFVDELKKAGLHDFEDFDDFYFGYTIEHISKEFDLLRIGQNFTLNIELKHQSSKEKVLKQLRLNHYYLKSVFPKVHYFSYVVNTGTLYCLSDNQLMTSEISQLVRFLKHQHVLKNIDIEALFEPSKFLVSPYSQAEDFLQDRYFLTNQQQDFKNKIIDLLNEKKPYIGLEGMAGTGKTLLLYDIAKSLMNNHRIAICHGGLLSDGHLDLKRHGYNIFDANEEIAFEDFEIVFIDEAQRLDVSKIQRLMNTKTSFVFAYDGYDLLHQSPHALETIIPKDCLFKLSNHIRINPHVMQFISLLFEPKTISVLHLKDYIEIKYFQDPHIALNWLNYSKDNGFELLDDTIEGAKTSLEIIGLDFEKVIVLLDDCFEVKNGKLFSKDADNLKKLYLRLTRARKRFELPLLITYLYYNIVWKSYKIKANLCGWLFGATINIS